MDLFEHRWFFLWFSNVFVGFSLGKTKSFKDFAPCFFSKKGAFPRDCLVLEGLPGIPRVFNFFKGDSQAFEGFPSRFLRFSSVSEILQGSHL